VTIKRLKMLEDENARLKRIVRRPDTVQADPAGGCPKKALKAAKRRELAAWMTCQLALLRPSVWYQKSEARDQSALRLRIRESADRGRQVHV
jgi:hypothetical protein